MIQVVLPSQLESYSGGARQVTLDLGAPPVAGLSLAAVLAALDQRFPGLRFRVVDEQGQIRRHIAIFVGELLVRDLALAMRGDERVQIVGALSGG